MDATPAISAMRSIPGSVESPSGDWRVPAWMDGRYQLVTAMVMTREITIAPGATDLIAPGSAARYMIGFTPHRTIAGAVFVSYMSAPIDYGRQIGATVDPLWYTVFEHGPTVCAQWYGYSLTGATFLLTEVSVQR